MVGEHRPPLEQLQEISSFKALLAFLRRELDWPVNEDDLDEAVFDYTPEEVGLDSARAAAVRSIRQLRPLVQNQPWGIFYVEFEPKRLPVVVLRRLLAALAPKRRASAQVPGRAVWQPDDLLFIVASGETDDRGITFAHFQISSSGRTQLRTFSWDESERHFYYLRNFNLGHLRWPSDPTDGVAWRDGWRLAFPTQHREVIRTARDLSIALALVASRTRRSIEALYAYETSTGPLHRLFAAFRAALIHDLSVPDFADLVAQTISYGLFSARATGQKVLGLEHLESLIPATNPFLRELMGELIQADQSGSSNLDLDELGVDALVSLLNNADLDAVLMDFGRQTGGGQEDPVIHFYESFLLEYDPKQKVRRGVFYTPRSVVSYIVRSVHELLQTEFGLADGLADITTWGDMARLHAELTLPEGVKPTDSFVNILDPATGTGTFLVEAIDLIYSTLVSRWQREGKRETEILNLWNDYVPEHLLPRLHGFELLVAPYAIAHLKMGLKLRETGYRFHTEARAQIYLTNSLEPARAYAEQFAFTAPALAHEAAAVNQVKQRQRFTVVVGNPPYSGVSSNMTAEAQRSVDAYKIVDGAPLNERKVWLQDDYVKFIRLAQLAIERAQAGVLGYITNHGYLDNPTFRGMRQSLLGTFHSLAVLDLHGNATKREVPPGGITDQNVFEIRQGVAITLATRLAPGASPCHADLWGTAESKYRYLQSHTAATTSWAKLTPESPYYFLEPRNTDWQAEYDRGWRINNLMPVNSSGFITARDHFVVGFDRQTLIERISDLVNPELSDNAIRQKYFAGRGSDKYLEGDSRGWKLEAVRRVVKADRMRQDRVAPCLYRPFDARVVYWADWMVDWPRPEVTKHMLSGQNLALQVCRQSVSAEWRHVLVAKGLVESCYVSNKTREIGYLLPLYLAPSGDGLVAGAKREANFDPAFVRELSQIVKSSPGQPSSRRPHLDAEDIVSYIYAVLHSPSYRARYAQFLTVDFPRVPLPSSAEFFGEMATRGRELIALHLVEAKTQLALSSRYVPSSDTWHCDVEGGVLIPLTLGFRGPKIPVVGSVAWSVDTVWLDAAKDRKGQNVSAVSGTVGFSGVPEAVWSFQIGGYQVCEKWLKDRKGRTLTADDISHYYRIVIALYETIRIMNEIDGVIDEHGGWPRAFWPGAQVGAPGAQASVDGVG